MTEPTFEELNRITLKAREDLDKKNSERFKNGREEAIKHITSNYADKMRLAAEKGYDQTDIYNFQWVEDKSSDKDSNGNIVKFGENVRLKDIITKGRTEFITDLNTFFNKDGNSRYNSGVYSKKDPVTNTIKQHIFVSWANRDIDNDKNISTNTVFRGGKNNFYSMDHKNMDLKNKNVQKNKSKYVKNTI